MYDTPSEVVSHMGAIQAQEYRMMRWAVAMRTTHPSARQFADEYNEGKILRLHLLRGTWQLISADNYWWMLALIADKSKRVINGWMKSNHISISDTEYDAIRDLLIATAQHRTASTKEDFAAALRQKGITMDDHRLSYHIRMAELDGVLCSGDLLSMKATYCLTSEKIQKPTTIDRDEALSRLARLYFLSHAPATLEDFLWWSGLTAGEGKRAISILGAELYTIKSDNREFYLHLSCRNSDKPRRNTILLPSYDEYLIGYKSRHLAIADQHRPQAFSNNGIFYPVIVSNGKICGNWKPFEKKLCHTLFEEDTAVNNLAQKWAQYTTYLAD